MNTQEKKEALVQAVEEIAGKEAAYWEGNPKRLWRRLVIMRI